MEIDEMKRIVVDSSASLYQLDGIDFASVPLKIVTDEREYLDDGTLDAVEMATTLRTYKGKTSTSCPNIGDWLEAYEGADEIYAITITGTLSGSCNAAQLAAEEYQAEHPGAQVFVLDSLSAGPELVLLAEHIRDLLAEGMAFDDVCEEMLRYRHHTHLLFSLESLANLARNGRIKPTVAAVARMLNIRVIGKGGHSAFPETCVDPIVIAGEIVGALQTLVSRRIQAVEPAVVSVCMIHAGEAYNIIPGEVAITGSTRTFSKETRERLPKLMEELARGICAAHGADCDFKFTLGYASVMNDKALTASSRKVIEEHFGESAVLEIDPLMPGEDFSALQENCPGFFVELGARSEEKGITFPHHNCRYLMDEDALKYGVEYLYQLVRSRLSIS